MFKTIYFIFYSFFITIDKSIQILVQNHLYLPKIYTAIQHFFNKFNEPTIEHF